MLIPQAAAMVKSAQAQVSKRSRRSLRFRACRAAANACREACTAWFIAAACVRPLVEAGAADVSGAFVSMPSIWRPLVAKIKKANKTGGRWRPLTRPCETTGDVYGSRKAA